MTDPQRAAVRRPSHRERHAARPQTRPGRGRARRRRGRRAAPGARRGPRRPGRLRRAGAGRRAGGRGAARGHHVLARASSSRSPGCAGTSATTAPSSPSPASCAATGTGCSCRRTRCWTSPAAAPNSGCKEALITLGDKPEDRWPEAREWLDAHGYDDTLAYVRAMAIRILEETGLLPHLNPGVLSWTDFQRLKPVAPSMGMMLETTADAAVERAGRPALRLARQGTGRAAAGAGGRGPVQRPVHQRAADRHRGDVRGARRVAVRAAPRSRAPTTASRN